MHGLNRYEITGIVVSIAVMAAALWYINYEPSPEEESQAAGEREVTEVAEGETELATALEEAATADGELTDLIVTDIAEGEGDVVEEGDTLVVEYIGATQDGVRFDSSYERGEQFIFEIGAGRVIEGWEEGLLGMRVGGQRVLVIPSDMGYGNRQVGEIPPNTNLVFAVELVEIR